MIIFSKVDSQIPLFSINPKSVKELSDKDLIAVAINFYQSLYEDSKIYANTGRLATGKNVIIVSIKHRDRQKETRYLEWTWIKMYEV